MNTNRRKLLVVASVIILILLAILGVSLILKSNPNNSQGSAELRPITLQNSSALSNVLLDKQYNAVYFDLSVFIPQKVNQSLKTVSISNVKVQPDGSVKFDVTAGNKSFSETVERSSFDKIGITIPQYSYQKTIQVY